jgi:CMP-N,N'-diacetyllegionaminic acid synthase
VKVLGIITARGGSKGVPRKNIKILSGKPLLQYTAAAALAAKGLTRVILSTDDQEIAEVGKRCGLSVPFLRPAELATDRAPSLNVLQHALRWVEEHGESFDAICLLQPTNPFRRSSDIDACIELMRTSEADAIVSILPVPSEFNPHWVYFRDDRGLLRLSTGEAAPIPRRQELPPAFHRDGSVYVTRRDVLIEKNSLYGDRVVGYPMDPRYSINIDLPEDWHEAEIRLKSEAGA